MSFAASAGPQPGNLAFVDFNAVHRRGQEESIAGLKAKVDLAELVGRYVQLRRRGRDLWAICPFHADKNPSLKVDEQRQRWRCFGCDAGGDALDFLALAERLDPAAAILRLREITGSTTPPKPPRMLPPVEAGLDLQAEANRERAQDVWRNTQDIPRQGLPYEYLTERRGLSRWDPDRLRWHPECLWRGGTAGCIVAPINGKGAGLVTGIWRILPALKGPVQRLGLGPTRGNASRLYHPEGEQLVVAEGIEDAIAAHEITGLPAWAALSAGNMAELVLPDRLREILILGDRDANEVGRASAHKLAARLRAEGRQVEVRLPTMGKDSNDVLRAKRAS